MSEFELQGDFEREVVQESAKQPVLVDFWASWCGPCRTLGPILQKLAGEAQGRFKLVKVDTQARPELAQRFGIQSIPAVKLFVDGTVVAEFLGALPEAQVRAWLKQQIPSETDRLFRAAEAILAAGERQRARENFEIVLQADPQHLGARYRLAEISLFEDPVAALSFLEPIPQSGKHAGRVEALRRLARQATVTKESSLTAVEGHEPRAQWVRRYLEGNHALVDRGAHLRSKAGRRRRAQGLHCSLPLPG
jgi:putative thioredoxin